MFLVLKTLDFFISDFRQRLLLSGIYFADVHTASDVQNIKAEVEKLQRFHEERKAVYDKFKEWRELWNEKAEHENHANDKSYYHNRGGQLQALLLVLLDLQSVCVDAC